MSMTFLDKSILLLIALITKHFIVDFPLQTKFQWSNKGKYGHLGGIIHAGLHSVGTYLCLIFLFPDKALQLSLLDGFIHYHVDWAKINLNKKFNIRPDNSEYFWWLLGLDQYLHYLTYILLLVKAL